MRIKRLVLSDFGKFHQQEFTLSPGLNIATGANESGKTTLRYFIRSMLFGLERERGIRARKDDYTRLKPWDYGKYQGSMEFEAEGKEYRLFRNFLTLEKQVTLTELETGKSIGDPEAFLRSLGLTSENIYTNTCWIGNTCGTKELLGLELRNYLANLAYNGGEGLNLQKSLSWLAERKKEVLKQIPEQELSACMEVMANEAARKEQLSHLCKEMEENQNRQKVLNDEIKAEKGREEQLLAEREVAEEEARKQLKGERLLPFLCTLGVGSVSITYFLTMWQLKLAGCLLGVAAILAGFFLALSMRKKGKQAGLRKKELDGLLLQSRKRLECAFEEITGLLPKLEQEKLRAEWAEEQLKQCEKTKERFEQLKNRKQELKQEADAIVLAAETLERLSDELYEEFGEKFIQALSRYAGAFTDHAYETLRADEKLNLRAITKDRTLELSDVSFGTGEQFYLALRFAAADVFDPEKKNTIILDDSFAAFDEQRLESAVLALQRCGRQVLILSSTGREESAAKRMGIAYEAVF